jgi:hypothetical protein
VGITSVLNLQETLPPTATGSPRAQRRRGCGGRPAQYMSPRQRRASPRSLSDGTSQEIVVVRYRDDHEAVTKVSTLASNHSEPPIAVVNAVDPLVRPSASWVTRVGKSVRRGVV